MNALTVTSRVTTGLAYNTGYYWRANATNAGWHLALVGHGRVHDHRRHSRRGDPLGTHNLVGQPADSAYPELELGGQCRYLRPPGGDRLDLRKYRHLPERAHRDHQGGQRPQLEHEAVLAGERNGHRRHRHLVIGWNFTTIIDTPGVPVLAAPSTGANNLQPSLTFSWSTMTGAASYNLQIATSSAFGTTVISQSGITTASCAVSGLANSASFFWEVSATNVGGTSSWSGVGALPPSLPRREPRYSPPRPAEAPACRPPLRSPGER